MRRAFAGPLLACVCIVATMISAGPVSAHGDLDQSLAGDPGCNSANFPVSAGVSSSPRQEFVPSGTLLSSVGVCLGSGAGATVDVHVRQGTAAAPGAIVGSKLGLPLAANSLTFVHADFLPASLPVTQGATYVIEVVSAGDVSWLGSADDQYAAGGTNAAAGDLAFRSYLDPAAPTVTATSAPAQPTSTPRPATNTPAATNAAPTSTAASSGATSTPSTGVVQQPTVAAAQGTGAAAPGGPGSGSVAPAAQRGAAATGSTAPVAGSGTVTSGGSVLDVIVLFVVSSLVINGSALIFVAGRARS